MGAMQTRTRRMRIVGTVSLSLGAVWACSGCNTQGFDPQTKVNSVRLFGVRADHPYAKPGDSVTLEALVTDGRTVKGRPMEVYWFPLLCLNPADDLYYNCFAPGAGDASASTLRLLPIGVGGDAGLSQGGLASLPTNVDLSPFLPRRSMFSFQLPGDALAPRTDSVPYGLGIVFNMACAGQARLLTASAGDGPQQQIPLACTDESGNRLPPSDYVIGFSRVYAYAEETNANPKIDFVTFEGAVVDTSAGINVDRCVGVTRRADCPEIRLNIHVSDDSWEPIQGPVVNGGAGREQIWATYYTDVGDLDADATLLFDGRSGRVSDNDAKYKAPYDAVEGSLWIVVHDNRGGMSWAVVPVHVR